MSLCSCLFGRAQAGERTVLLHASELDASSPERKEGRDPRADPGHAGEIASPTWLGNASASSQRRRWEQQGEDGPGPGLCC